MSGLDPTRYRALIEARIFEPQALTTALQARRRRRVHESHAGMEASSMRSTPSTERRG